MFSRFLHSQVFGAFVLIFTTAIALVWANSPWGQAYYDISHTYLGVRFGEAEFKLTLSPRKWSKSPLCTDIKPCPSSTGRNGTVDVDRLLFAFDYLLA